MFTVQMVSIWGVRQRFPLITPEYRLSLTRLSGGYFSNAPSVAWRPTTLLRLFSITRQFRRPCKRRSHICPFAPSATVLFLATDTAYLTRRNLRVIGS